MSLFDVTGAIAELFASGRQERNRELPHYFYDERLKPRPRESQRRRWLWVF